MTQYIFLLRSLGYGLLILALFDVINILVPPLFMNPNWEFQAVSALVEHTAIPLIGIGLVFYGEWHDRTKLEHWGLKYLSWLSLVIGVVLLLLLPLGISDAWRINNQNNAQIINQVSQQRSQLEQVRERLNRASEQELLNVAKSSNQTKLSSKNPQQIKEQLLSTINETETKTEAQSKDTRTNMFFSLLKNCIKLFLEELIVGILFIYTWRFTLWTRETINLK